MKIRELSPVVVVTLLVTVVWTCGYAVGAEWWPFAVAIGYAVGIPVAAVYDDRWTAGHTDSDDRAGTEETGERATRHDETTADATDESPSGALDALRERYARGDLTDDQFERKLERLLETETLENASEYRERARREREREQGREREREREHE